jgi:uncharacterized protein
MRAERRGLAAQLLCSYNLIVIVGAMMYEWDEDKNRLNIASHHIAFEAAERFEWSNAIIEIDDREDYRELREMATSFIGSTLHVMIFTERDGVYRIISLRKATKKEKQIYVGHHQR